MFLTRVGFGAWAVGGGSWAYAWGDQDDAESIAAIRHAVESGVNWIDTAAVYGLGHSEQVVAAALADLPEADRPYVFTKGGLVWDPADRTMAPRRVGDPASLRAEVEASLRRLRVERIDLYQMHWPAEDGTAVEEYWPPLPCPRRRRPAGRSKRSSRGSPARGVRLSRPLPNARLAWGRAEGAAATLGSWRRNSPSLGGATA